MREIGPEGQRLVKVKAHTTTIPPLIGILALVVLLVSPYWHFLFFRWVSGGSYWPKTYYYRVILANICIGFGIVILVYPPIVNMRKRAVLGNRAGVGQCPRRVFAKADYYYSDYYVPLHNALLLLY